MIAKLASHLLPMGNAYQHWDTVSYNHFDLKENYLKNKVIFVKKKEILH